MERMKERERDIKMHNNGNIAAQMPICGINLVAINSEASENGINGA